MAQKCLSGVKEKFFATKKGNEVHIKWEAKCLREGDPLISEEHFLKTKWNKHVEEG